MSHLMHANANANAMAFQIQPNKPLRLSFMDEEDEKQTTHAQVSTETAPKVVICEPEGEGVEAWCSPHHRKLLSPESPWTLSPLRTPSVAPPLVYHCIASLHRGKGNIYSIAISKGVVFTGSDSTRIRAWKQPDCMDRGYLKAAAGGVKAISASGNMLLTSHKDLRIRVWNFTVSEKLRSKKVCSLPKRRSFMLLPRTETAQLHKDTISCMGYYHADGLLYTASHDRTVKAWRLSDRKCVDSFLAHDDHVNSLTLNQADGCLFTASSDATVKIWRRLYRDNSHTLTMTLKFQTSPVNAVVLDADATLLYSGCSDGTVNFWEKEKQSYRYKHMGLLQGHRFAVLCLAVAEKLKLVLSGSEDTTVRIWRKQEGGYCHECVGVLEGHRGPVRCLAATLEMENIVSSFLVYSGSLDQTFKVWRVKVVLALGDDKNKMWLDYGEGEAQPGDSIYNNLGLGDLYHMSPVLSPSWVQKKLQANYF